MLPPVVTFTRSPAVALIAVRMPFGSPVPGTDGQLLHQQLVVPLRQQVDISDANPG